MEIEVEFTRDELYRAVKVISRSSFRQFKSTGTYKILTVLSVATVLAFGASSLTFIHRSVVFDYGSFLMMLFLFVCYTFLFRYVTGEFNRFVIYNSKRYTGAVRYKLDDTYLYVQDNGITSRFRWGSFYRFEDTPELMLLYIDIHQAVIIPKKDEKVKEFAAAVRGKLEAASV